MMNMLLPVNNTMKITSSEEAMWVALAKSCKWADQWEMKFCLAKSLVILFNVQGWVLALSTSKGTQ